MLFFQNLPKVYYALDGQSPIIITNIMTRVRLKNFIRKNAYVYYTYQVKDTDSPSTIAHKYYGDPNREWLVFLANDIIDPNYDWVMTYDVFQKFIAGKYGSISAAQLLTHHYEKQIVKTDSASGVASVKVLKIDENTYNTMPSITSVTYNLTNGTSVSEVTTKNFVNCYDFEDQLNESKRTIQLVGKQYVSEIEAQFKALMK